MVWLALGPVWGLPLVPSLALFVWGALHESDSTPLAVRRLSRVSYGIFLTHGFFVEAPQLVATRIGIRLESTAPTLVAILMAVVLSWLLCEIIYRFPRWRWLII